MSKSTPAIPRDELFDDVADQFERGEQPLNLAWMERRAVTLDELRALSGKIALVLRGYRAMAPRDRIAFVGAGIFQTGNRSDETIPHENHNDTNSGERVD